MSPAAINGLSGAELWGAVDHYFDAVHSYNDAALSAAVSDSDHAGLPAIQVAPNQGKLLHLIAKLQGAKNILEIGTLGGYSTIWMARALPPDGTLISLEVDSHHAEVARNNIARAGLADRVEVRLGKALDTLPGIAMGKRAPFDLIFIDADKQNIVEYFEWSLKMSRPGSMIIVDNVVRDGAVIDANTKDASVQGVQRFAKLLTGDARVSATTLQTVGGKGYDGITFALVLGDAT